jgi:DNA-binding transcriptional LysR family regulator
MEMRQVVYFRALAEELNFTRAARRSNVSQPSLTRSIRLLEEEFGGPLFHRVGSKTRLSELGRIVKPHLDQVFEQASLANLQARNFQDLQKIHLKLGIMCTVAPADLIPLISGIRTRHPGISLDVFDAEAERLDRQLKDGQLDIAIACRPENQRDPQLHFLPLFREQFMIVTHMGHRFANLDEVRVCDLHREPYLRRVNCDVGELAGMVFSEQQVSPNIVYRSDRDDWINAMAAAGMGYAFMPVSSVTHPDLTTKPLVDPEFWREVSLVTVRGRPHTPAVGALVHEAMRSTWMNERALAVTNMERRTSPSSSKMVAKRHLPP